MSKIIFTAKLGKGSTAISNIANYFNQIIMLENVPWENIPYQIPKEKIFSFNTQVFNGNINIFKRLFFDLPGLYYRIKKFKQENNIKLSLSFGEPANLFNALTKRKKEKIVLSFRVYYSIDLKYFLGKKITLGNIIRKIVYKFAFKNIFNKKADLFIVPSFGIKKDLVDHFGLEKEKFVVIYNPVDIEKVNNKAKEPLGEYEQIFEKPVLITVGRLIKQKGQWYLLRIFKEIKKYFPEIKLVILGEGELKKYLTTLSKNLGLKTFIWDKNKLSKDYDVYFLGFQENPFKFMFKSNLFIFTSLWEGLPNILIEAGACHLPIICADCRSGPREILAPDTPFDYQAKTVEFAKYGILLPPFEEKFKKSNEPLSVTEKLWIETIKNVIENKKLQAHYAQKSLERSKDFELKKILKEWETTLDKLMKS